MSSFLFSIPSFSFQKGVRKEETGEMRERDIGREREREREREKRKRDHVRGKEKREPRRDELPSSLCPSFVLPLSLKAEGEKKRKRRRINQRKERGRDQKNEEFTSSISMLIPLS